MCRRLSRPIIQAEQLGVSIGKILRIQSDQMRIRRRQRAEEAAHKAPILMLIRCVLDLPVAVRRDSGAGSAEADDFAGRRIGLSDNWTKEQRTENKSFVLLFFVYDTLHVL